MKKNLHIITLVLGVASLNLIVMAHEGRIINERRRMMDRYNYDAAMYYRHHQIKLAGEDSATAPNMHKANCCGH